MWPIGISTGIAYRHPIEATLEPIRASGLTQIEVSTAPQHVDLRHDWALRDLAQRIRERGLAVQSLHAPFGHDINLTSPDPHQRAQAVERLVRAADALAILGGGMYVIHPAAEDQRWVWERESRLAMSVEGLGRIHAACVARGLTLVLETPLPHLLGGQLDDFAWILARIPEEHTGVCDRHLTLLSRRLSLRCGGALREPSRPPPGERQPRLDRRSPASGRRHHRLAPLSRRPRGGGLCRRLHARGQRKRGHRRARGEGGSGGAPGAGDGLARVAPRPYFPGSSSLTAWAALAFLGSSSRERL